LKPVPTNNLADRWHPMGVLKRHLCVLKEGEHRWDSCVLAAWVSASNNSGFNFWILFAGCPRLVSQPLQGSWQMDANSVCRTFSNDSSQRGNGRVASACLISSGEPKVRHLGSSGKSLASLASNKTISSSSHCSQRCLFSFP
jgi:hypothetical protein